MILEILAILIWKEKEIKGLQIVKIEIKTLLT
jgi:hypothetical protein